MSYLLPEFGIHVSHVMSNWLEIQNPVFFENSFETKNISEGNTYSYTYQYYTI